MDALFGFLLILLATILVVKGVKRLTYRTRDQGESTPTPIVETPRPVEAIPMRPKSSTNLIAYRKQGDIAENNVDWALRQLNERRYFVFRDLIIPSSSKSLSLTQIDHVVVSQKGIFCIETKSHQGNIYGFTRSEHWKQYLGKSGKPFDINSPYRQNKHHVSSLERLLAGNLRAPVHSYLAFPNAHKVVVDSKQEDMTLDGVVAKINHHTSSVYDLDEVERIAKLLAHAGTFREQLRDKHADEVRAFIDAKVSGHIKHA